jgi:hypothetical protein
MEKGGQDPFPSWSRYPFGARLYFQEINYGLQEIRQDHNREIHEQRQRNERVNFISQVESPLDKDNHQGGLGPDGKIRKVVHHHFRVSPFEASLFSGLPAPLENQFEK